MKKILFVCFAVFLWLTVDLIVLCDSPPPIQPLPAQSTKMPPVKRMGPTRQTSDGGPTTKRQSTKKIVKKEKYIVVGMYDNMLKITQSKRFWPIGDSRYDGCIMMHNNTWICQ